MQVNERDHVRGDELHRHVNVYVYIRDRSHLHAYVHENAHAYECDRVRDYLTFQPPPGFFYLVICIVAKELRKVNPVQGINVRVSFINSAFDVQLINYNLISSSVADCFLQGAAKVTQGGQYG